MGVHGVVILESLVLEVDSPADPVCAVEVDGEDDNVLGKDIDLPKAHNQPVHGMQRGGRAHLFRPPRHLALRIVNRQFGVKETIEPMYLPPRLSVLPNVGIRSLLHHRHVEVDDFVVEPLPGSEKDDVFEFDLCAVAFAGEGLTAEPSSDLADGAS